MKLALAAAGCLAVIGAVAVISLSLEPDDSRSGEVTAEPAEPLPLNADAARGLLAGGALLADVREPIELAETGKLEGALNLPLTTLKQHAAHGSTPAELGVDKNRPVILYCRSGRRSQEAGQILLRHGFTRVYNLGGYEDAVKAGLPTA